MEYLPWGNQQGLGELAGDPPINAHGKHVVILGGGDTGADCLGTAIRQGAASVTQLEILPRPTEERPANQPWPTYPMIDRVSSAHEEAGERIFAVSPEFINGKFERVAGSEREIPADLVFLAMGFLGPEKSELISQLEVQLDQRGNVLRDEKFATSEEGIFVCGDAGRGQSLIVWAIAEGRSAAAAVDEYLLGETGLPAPILPTSRSLTV